MPLSREQCRDLRVLLENRYNALLAEIRAGRTKAGQATAQMAESRSDPDARAAALQATGIADAELGRDWLELESIQQALTRMDKGEYGTCADCGQPIALRRLMNAPAATRCLDCQQAFER
ncbi:MAG TPA: TraR/DksA family transcriptional regulator, partial [Burkholderiales bacterium]|nr:TraR/DksA family transcriptional regulator [Burkholderiales bacterium]